MTTVRYLLEYPRGHCPRKGATHDHHHLPPQPLPHGDAPNASPTFPSASPLPQPNPQPTPRAPQPSTMFHNVPPPQNVQNEPKCASQAGEVSRMKESHDQGLAHQIDPESCAAAREGVGEALTGADAGRPCTVPKAFTVPDADAHLGVRKATPAGSPWREPAGSGGAAEPVHASKHLAKMPAVPASSAQCAASAARRVTEAGRSHVRPRSVNRGPHRQSLTREHRDDERA